MATSSLFAVIGLLSVMSLMMSTLSGTPAQAGDTAKVYFVQGLVGKTVDITVDSKTVARGVPSAKIVGPFTVTAGTPTVTVRDSSGVLVQKRLKLGAGANMDVVFHRPADPKGAPVLTWFANDLSAVPAGKASLTVAHTAVVGPADIRVNGKVLFANIANGESLNLVVPASTYTVEIVPAGAKGPIVLGPAKLEVAAGSLTRVFAIGNPTSKTMQVTVQVLTAPTSGSAVPKTVDTGTGGQAAALGLTTIR
jgi:hypothetical protein